MSWSFKPPITHASDIYEKPCMRNKMSLKKHFMFNQYFTYMVNYLATQETLNKLLSCLGTAEIYQIHILFVIQFILSSQLE